MQVSSEITTHLPNFLHRLHAEADSTTRTQLRRFLCLARKYKVFSSEDAKASVVLLQRLKGEIPCSFYEAAVIAVMIVAKLHMDKSFDNDAYAQISNLSLHRINALEAMVFTSGVDLDVLAYEYQTIDAQLLDFMSTLNHQQFTPSFVAPVYATQISRT